MAKRLGAYLLEARIVDETQPVPQSVWVGHLILRSQLANEGPEEHVLDYIKRDCRSDKEEQQQFIMLLHANPGSLLQLGLRDIVLHRFLPLFSRHKCWMLACDVLSQGVRGACKTKWNQDLHDSMDDLLVIEYSCSQYVHLTRLAGLFLAKTFQTSDLLRFVETDKM